MRARTARRLGLGAIALAAAAWLGFTVAGTPVHASSAPQARTYALLANGYVPVSTGGSLATRALELDTLTITLGPGRYLLGVNAVAHPYYGGTGAVQVFPQFSVYDRVAGTQGARRLFRTGAGALESGAGWSISSYYSGESGVVTLTAPSTTLRAYAFGADSDGHEGRYVLTDYELTVEAVQ